MDVVERVVSVASANLESLEQKPKLIAAAIAAALSLARGALSGRINGANLAPLVEELLVHSLWDELDPSDEQKLKEAALEILRAA